MFQNLKWSKIRNPLAFWILGLCNAFAFVIMLSGAEDIMAKQNHKIKNNETDFCYEKITEAHCSSISTGAVLLADILPTIIVELTFPFFMHKIPYGIRTATVLICQILSFIIVAFSSSVAMSLTGVVFAALGSGIGVINCLALTSYFPKTTVATYSSGTGSAHIIASLCYAVLTEPHFINLSLKATLLIMLFVPILYGGTFWGILDLPSSVYKVNIFDPRTYIINTNLGLEETQPAIENEHHHTPVAVSAISGADVLETKEGEDENFPEEKRIQQRHLTFNEKIRLFGPLLKYMLPIALVYFGEYLINQGVLELIYFDCSHGFQLSKQSQYRWFQVLYQFSVFLSRSSVSFFELPMTAIYLLPVLQLGNALFLIFNAIYFFVPHILIIFGIILFEGLLGGLSYVNTFHRIHKDIEPDIREFSLSAACVSDAFGIVFSAFTAIPLHNFICHQQQKRL